MMSHEGISSRITETVIYLFFTAYGISECIIFIMVKYLRLYILLWKLPAFLVLTIDDMGDASLLIRYIMVIGLRLLTVRTDQPQSPDIADHIAIGLLFGGCFPVLIIEEFYQLSVFFHFCAQSLCVIMVLLEASVCLSHLLQPSETVIEIRHFSI